MRKSTRIGPWPGKIVYAIPPEFLYLCAILSCLFGCVRSSLSAICCIPTGHNPAALPVWPEPARCLLAVPGYREPTHAPDPQAGDHSPTGLQLPATAGPSLIAALRVTTMTGRIRPRAESTRLRSRPSAREYPSPVSPDYPFHDRAIRASQCGRICSGHRRINFSTLFAGPHIGIRVVADPVWPVSFMHDESGIFDRDENRVEPLG